MDFSVCAREQSNQKRSNTSSEVNDRIITPVLCMSTKLNVRSGIHVLTATWSGQRSSLYFVTFKESKDARPHQRVGKCK